MAGTVRWGPKGQGFPFPEVGLSKTLHPADLDGSALSMGTGARHIPQDWVDPSQCRRSRPNLIDLVIQAGLGMRWVTPAGPR